MGRRIEGPTPGTIVPHVLKCFDEKDKNGSIVGYDHSKDPTPVKVNFKWPTEDDRRGLYDVIGDMSNLKDKSHTLKDYVASVENYERPDGTPILTGPDFATHAELQAVTEAFTILLFGIKKVDDQVKKG